MTCGDDGRVVFVVKGGAAEVNKSHRGVIYSPLVAFLKEEVDGKGETLHSEEGIGVRFLDLDLKCVS